MRSQKRARTRVVWACDGAPALAGGPFVIIAMGLSLLAPPVPAGAPYRRYEMQYRTVLRAAGRVCPDFRQVFYASSASLQLGKEWAGYAPVWARGLPWARGYRLAAGGRAYG